MKLPLFALLLAASLAAAGAPAHASSPFAQARDQFLAATRGDTAARDAAIEAFAKLAESQPEHPVYLAYHGAALTLKGRDASKPWEKMRFAEQGADRIEKALARLGPQHDAAIAGGSPESIETRAVAANSLLALPAIMHRGGPGKRALQAALDSPLLDGAHAATRASVFGAAARLAAKEGRAADEAQWQRRIVALPANAAGIAAMRERAAARLKELGQ
ncbi:hypothetical protein OU994_24655 [Pseudoduganella sp. SL102]|uniref:hypothetical protein n=1 Tax=Pseudoduganella sp. SL102 TaxID=2995154 RepID=UPI00248C7FBD|nr:hypothetical protein [Pseudoduganella sp. SL102]WBS01435.1 hypothetical protein OU994_24655 [Pseudoduganella sp. SL102]